MTIATNRGFKIGELYRVIDTYSEYYKIDGIMKFVRDDGSTCPWFEHISGPEGTLLSGDGGIAVELEHLVPVESTSQSSEKASNATSLIIKPLLLLYIQQQYPNDKVLNALVESL